MSKNDQNEIARAAVTAAPPAKKSLSDKFADVATRTIGSIGFVAAQTLTLGLWVGGNMLAQTWDPASQIILNLALSFQAAYTGPLVMITQNRQADQDRKARENDYQVNLEAERRVEALHRKVDTLLTTLAPVVSVMTPAQRAELGISEDLLQQILDGRGDGQPFDAAKDDDPEIAPEKPTLSERFADAVTGKIGSWKFIAAQTASLALWIGANATALVQHWDPYPFIMLNLALSFQAAYTGPLVMISQNRQTVLDRKAREIDYRLNRESEHRIERLNQKIDTLVTLVGRVMEVLTPSQRGTLGYPGQTPASDAARTDTVLPDPHQLPPGASGPAPNQI
jgi:uncharacterized membrane protein